MVLLYLYIRHFSLSLTDGWTRAWTDLTSMFSIDVIVVFALQLEHNKIMIDSAAAYMLVVCFLAIAEYELS